MIAPEDVTAEVMEKALATTLAALEAAVGLDVDRTDDDRALFSAEQAALKPHFDAVLKADNELRMFVLLTSQARQAAVQVGDTVLDRGVSKGKARTKVELKGSSMEDGADHVFGKDVSEITQAERAKEPALVLEAVAKLPQIPAFPGKAELALDLTGRATRQKKNFEDREAAAVQEAALDGVLRLAIKAGSQALYQLEKRLLERFPRQTAYVKAFFYDAAPAKKKAKEPTEPKVSGG